MNPGGKIWAYAVGFCFLAVPLSAVAGADAAAVMLFIFLIVLVASLISLVCFIVLFEVLKQLRPAPSAYWPLVTIGLSLLVLGNAYLLLALVDIGSNSDLYETLQVTAGCAAIPLLCTLSGLLCCRKGVTAFFSSD